MKYKSKADSAYKVTSWFQCPECGERKKHGIIDSLSRLVVRCSECDRRNIELTGIKQCRICGEEKPLSDFYKIAKMRGGVSNECIDCIREIRRAQFILRRYGISQEEYEVLYQQQEGLCAICGTEGRVMIAGPGPLQRSSREFPQLFVDHDHKTNAVRGLLCHDCNIGLGVFQDNTILLRTAIAYLNNHANKDKTA